MPVVLEREDENTWLHSAADEALAVCGSYDGGDMAAYEISTAVNNHDNEDPEIIEPVGSESDDG